MTPPSYTPDFCYQRTMEFNITTASETSVAASRAIVGVEEVSDVCVKAKQEMATYLQGKTFFGSTYAGVVALVIKQFMEHRYNEKCDLDARRLGDLPLDMPRRAIVQALAHTLRAHVDKDPARDEWRVRVTDYVAAYEAGVERFKRTMPGIVHATALSKQLADMKYPYKRVVAEVGRTVKQAGFECGAITTMPQVGARDGALAQSRPDLMSIGKADPTIFTASAGKPDLRSRLVKLAETHAYTNGEPGAHYERLAQVTKRHVPVDTLIELRSYLEVDPPLAATRLLDSSGVHGDVGAVLNAVSAAPCNEMADPGSPYIIPGVSDKSNRWTWQHLFAERFVKQFVCNQHEETEGRVSNYVTGMQPKATNSYDNFISAWDQCVEKEPLLKVYGAKPKYDCYPCEWVEETVVTKSGEPITGVLPVLPKGKVRMYFVQPGAFRQVTYPAADALARGMRCWGNCVKHWRDTEGRLHIAVTADSSAKDSGRIPWSGLGFSPYGGGMEALHKLLYDAAMKHGYAVVMYGDDSLCYWHIGGRVLALGLDASRFDLSQPHECAELFEAAYIDPLRAAYNGALHGAYGAIAGSLELTKRGLFQRDRPVLLAGNVATIIDGGAASGARCLTESNSAVAYASVCWIMERAVCGMIVHHLGATASMSDAELCAAVQKQVEAAGASFGELTGMSFGVEAIDVVPPIESNPGFNADSPGPIVHQVPFLGRNFRYARTSHGHLAVIGTLQTDRADRKVVWDTTSMADNEDGAELLARRGGKHLSYYLDRGFVDPDRSTMARTAYGCCGGAVAYRALASAGLATTGAPEAGVITQLWPPAMVLRFHTGEIASLGVRPEDLRPFGAFRFMRYDDTGPSMVDATGTLRLPEEVIVEVTPVRDQARPLRPAVPSRVALASGGVAAAVTTAGTSGKAITTAGVQARNVVVSTTNLQQVVRTGYALTTHTSTWSQSGVPTLGEDIASAAAIAFWAIFNKPKLLKEAGWSKAFKGAFLPMYGLDEGFAGHCLGMYPAEWLAPPLLGTRIIAPLIAANDKSVLAPVGLAKAGASCGFVAVKRFRGISAAGEIHEVKAFKGKLYVFWVPPKQIGGRFAWRWADKVVGSVASVAVYRSADTLGLPVAPGEMAPLPRRAPMQPQPKHSALKAVTGGSGKAGKGARRAALDRKMAAGHVSDDESVQSDVSSLTQHSGYVSGE